MKNWHSYWNRASSQHGEKEFLRQVGKTVNGVPITTEEFDLLIRELEKLLSLQAEDTVLDLCCGNGIITRVVAENCRYITGIDYSKPLIAIAEKYHQPKNARYMHSSVLDLSPEMFRSHACKTFTKIYMYEALQHFEPGDLAVLLARLTGLTMPETVVCLASVPDRDRLWAFYNTPERREEYHRRMAEGTEAIGTWWERGQLEKIARDAGFRARFVSQNPKLHTAHYRFDVVLTG